MSDLVAYRIRIQRRIGPPLRFNPRAGGGAVWTLGPTVWQRKIAETRNIVANAFSTVYGPSTFAVITTEGSTPRPRLRLLYWVGGWTH
jgi:hypothetical protein